LWKIKNTRWEVLPLVEWINRDEKYISGEMGNTGVASLPWEALYGRR
jgi:hypothetical protein